MKDMSFEQWLISVKQMSNRSARDVISRQKRVKKITGSDSIKKDTLELLVANEQFQQLTMYIKSQLKRTVALALEHQESINE
jgi:hypothetical protein